MFPEFGSFFPKKLKDLINFSEQLAITNFKAHFGGKMAKGRISKRVFQEIKAREIFF